MKIEDLFLRCERYLLEEPKLQLKKEIKDLLVKNMLVDLYDRMLDLSFGTAGLRGQMEAGYNRMNYVSVFRFGFALASLFTKKSKVVIGFDARHNSKNFALEISIVLRALGNDVYLFPSCVPTPVCAYAAKFFESDASVMVTASHNPARDNGIKLFSGTSAQAYGQILVDIEKAMRKAPLRHEFHHRYSKNLDDAHLHHIKDEVIENYLRELKSTQFFPEQKNVRTIKVVYTPLHGVGKDIFLLASKREGFSKIVVVKEQALPDADFITVDFPNPEEEHTLDLAHALGVRKQCDVVLANDPDADRLQVSCPDLQSAMKKLSGNEIGYILGYFSLVRALECGIRPILASSIVSSRLLKAMCTQMQAEYVDALTGFSNIVQTALEKESKSKNNWRFMFGFEEAIGFLIGRVVLDKDGIHAGVRFMEIINHLKANGKTIWQFLDELYLKFGLFVSSSWSKRFDGAESLLAMKLFMQKVRNIDPQDVAALLDQSESVKYDLLETQKNNSYEGLRADIVIFEIKNSGRIIIRPSGTEPKIKFYVELWEQATDQQMLSNKRAKLGEMIEKFKSKSEILWQRDSVHNEFYS